MVVDHRLAAGAAIQIRMHHLPDDRARADDRDLHDEIVEARRLEPRQRRHLRARLDLKHADRVGRLQHRVDGGIVRQVGEIDTCGAAGCGVLRRVRCRVPAACVLRTAAPALRPAVRIHQPNRVLQHRHHAEAQQIDLDDAHVGAVVLVPLHDDAAGHAGVFERDDRRQLALADHHAAGVLAEMPRQVLHLIPEPREVLHAAIAGIEAGGGHVAADACRPDRRTRTGSSPWPADR